MKFFVVVALTVLAVASAEPPRPRFRFRSQRQEEIPTTEPAATDAPAEAPYPPSGWRPAGAEFRLPARQQLPKQIYGPPSTEPTTEPDAEVTAQPGTARGDADPELERQQQTPNKKQNQKLINKNGSEEESEEIDVDSAEADQKGEQQGIYYILLPSGQLSKVQYVTMGDLNSAYTAQLKYQEVKPIAGPIYSFGPNGELIRLA